MKQLLVRIVVEGSKDAYFLYAFLLKCFKNELTPIDPPSSNKLKFCSGGEKMVFRHLTKNCEVDYSIVINGGYKNLGVLKKYLTDSDPIRKLVCTAIVFDSDNLGESDDSGQSKRREFLERNINSLILGIKSENGTPAQEHKIFLFPDNKRNGDLETLLIDVAFKVHCWYFIVCWKVFSCLLRAFNYLMLSNKSMIYDYVEAMYGKTNKVAMIKEKQGYVKNMLADGLWNWNVKSLSALRLFIFDLLNKW